MPARTPATLPLVAAAMLAAPGPGQDDLDARVRQALERARPALEKALVQTHGNALGLVCLAGLSDGMGGDDRAFAFAVARLARLRTSGTYAPALRLMVAAGYRDFPDRRDVARRDLAELLTHQTPGGGFGYVANTSYQDLSNTQFAALGLRAAVSLGLAVPEDVWTRLLATVLAAQQEGGGFAYHADRAPDEVTLSMTAAGIGVLEICRQHLELEPARDRVVLAAIEAGWGWIAEHGERIGDEQVANCLYAHYGLERAGILSDRAMAGAVDWYRTGAEMILAMQREGGEFRSPTDSHGWKAQTAFAVLFLRRNFPRTLAPAWPITPERKAERAR